jgi:tetratricopeptide (TPR) repeat protein
MKLIIAAISCLIFFTGYVYINHQSNNIDAVTARQKVFAYKQRFTVACAANISAFNLDDSSNIIPLLDGWGNHRMPVTSSNDSAYIYFQQGINMYYGFHIIEALASFDKSTKFDNNFAMGYWGKALSYGPNINDLGYAASPDALTAAQKAKDLSATCSPVEKALIDAMMVRYSADTTQTREHLNQLYADAMKSVYQQFPESLDASTLYADALMLQHPWDLYDRYGKPKAWTPEIVNVLEGILAKDPQHPGAAHYYIHAVEASDHPEKALKVAAELPSLMPGVAHLVHMPAHIYIRTGHYEEGYHVNDLAVKSYENYLSKYPAVINNSPLYFIHNLHMQATCANMDGRYADAIRVSYDARNSFDTGFQSFPDFIGAFVQYVYMTPVLTQIRFGKWDDILKDTVIPSYHIYANLLWHYARGLAFARKHDFNNANTELKALQEDLKNDQLRAPANYGNPAINGARVAEKILTGEIAAEQNNLQQAIVFLNQAVQLEDSMIYNEPKDWVHPARQYLGTVLIKAGKYAEAANAFTEDEKLNPNNGWSYTGLAIALTKQGKNKEAASAEKLARKAFERSDVNITAAVF